MTLCSLCTRRHFDGEVWPHLMHKACIITSRHECIVSPSRVHLPPHSALCAVNILMQTQSWFMFTMQQPLSGLQTVCVVVAAGFLYSMREICIAFSIYL